VAAGNEGGNSCAFSPSGCRQSISVGSEDELDQVAGFSNTGHCVTVFAPGTQIKSAGIANDDDVMFMSGTRWVWSHRSHPRFPEAPLVPAETRAPRHPHSYVDSACAPSRD
jgi:hypothetical protein